MARVTKAELETRIASLERALSSAAQRETTETRIRRVAEEREASAKEAQKEMREELRAFTNATRQLEGVIAHLLKALSLATQSKDVLPGAAFWRPL